jgi:GTP-binding protein
VKKFVDEVIIEVASGSGGDGAVSFRREKYVPKGGPDGGDGGKGGDVIFVLQKNLKTLSHLKQLKIFHAENGKPGGKKRKSGKSGKDILIPVPPGTIIKDALSKHILNDLSNDIMRWKFLEGGKGGKGNWHFATSTNRTPRYAKPGSKGSARKIICELNIIADVGLVGLPNAGKSTLLSVLTNARPKIAQYPFTTTIPNLGVMSYKNNEVIIADIPGIIYGASHGAGLGLQFLKHMARTKILIFLIDCSSPNLLDDYNILKNEIKTFSEDLLSRKQLIVLSKVDLAYDSDLINSFKKIKKHDKIIEISSINGLGINELKNIILKTITDEKK